MLLEPTGNVLISWMGFIPFALATVALSTPVDRLAAFGSFLLWFIVLGRWPLGKVITRGGISFGLGAVFLEMIL